MSLTFQQHQIIGSNVLDKSLFFPSAGAVQTMQFDLHAFHLKFVYFFFRPQDASVVVHNPPNTQSVELYFRGEKMAKVALRLSPEH